MLNSEEQKELTESMVAIRKGLVPEFATWMYADSEKGRVARQLLQQARIARYKDIAISALMKLSLEEATDALQEAKRWRV
jgi:hypothetical protein